MYQSESSCVQVWDCVYRYGTVYTGMGLCVQVWDCVYRYGTVYTGMGLCVQVWDCVYRCTGVGLCVKASRKMLFMKICICAKGSWICECIWVEEFVDVPEEVEFLPYKHMRMTHFVSCYKHTPLHVMFVCFTPSSSSSSSTSLPRKRYRSSSNCRSNSSSSLVSLTGRLDFSPNWLLSSNRLRMSYLDHINKQSNITLEDQFMEDIPVHHQSFIPHPGQK